MGEQLGAREEFTASHEFLDGNKTRYGIKLKKLHGQAGEVLLKLFMNGAQLFANVSGNFCRNC